MNQKEKELITEEFVLREDTYNLGVGGEGGAHFKGKKHSEETLKLLSDPGLVERRTIGLKKRYQSGKLEVWNKNKKQTEEHNAKIGETRKGSTHSEETKAKIAASITGKKHSEETKQKMREAKLKKR